MNAAALGLSGAAVVMMMTLGALLFALINRSRVKRRFKLAAKHSSTLNKCLVVRPCAGVEDHLRECLLSISSATCDFPIRILLAVDDPDDAALPTLENVREVLSARGFAVSVVIAPVIGPNRKAAIIAECLRLEGHDAETLLVADSNVNLTGYNLNQLIAGLFDDARTGAVWAPFREVAAVPSFGNTASEAVLHYSWHSFGLLSAVDPGGMVGKLFAVRKDALKVVSDFRNLVGVLGEDMALSRALRTAGYKVICAPDAAVSPMSVKTWGETRYRHTRWMLVIKSQRPALLASYPLLFFNSLWVYLVALLCAPVLPKPAAALFGAAFLIRLSVGYAAARMLDISPPMKTLLPGIFIADVLLLSAFRRALFTRSFTWRGRALRINRAGVLESVASAGEKPMAAK